MFCPSFIIYTFFVDTIGFSTTFLFSSLICSIFTLFPSGSIIVKSGLFEFSSSKHDLHLLHGLFSFRHNIAFANSFANKNLPILSCPINIYALAILFLAIMSSSNFLFFSFPIIFSKIILIFLKLII